MPVYGKGGTKHFVFVYLFRQDDDERQSWVGGVDGLARRKHTQQRLLGFADGCYIVVDYK